MIEFEKQTQLLGCPVNVLLEEGSSFTIVLVIKWSSLVSILFVYYLSCVCVCVGPFLINFTILSRIVL